MEAKVFNSEAKESGTVNLPEEIFALPWNPDLVYQVVKAMRSNARSNTAQTKDRGAVRGGGRKPWRQKGTGRARHGSIRSPLWRGGGVTHGPDTARNYFKKVNKKVKIKALYTLLSQKLRDDEIIFLDRFFPAGPKTKEGQAILNRLALLPDREKINYRRGRRALLVLPNKDESIFKSFRNIPSAAIKTAQQLNPVELLNYRYLVVLEPERTLAVLSGRKRR